MTERYLRVAKRRRVISVAIILLGAAVIAAMALSRGRVAPPHMWSLFAGTGGAFIANGVVQFYRYTRRIHNSQAQQKAAVEEYDERSVAVMRRASHLSMNVLLIVGYIAMIAAAYVSVTICYTLLVSLCVLLVVWMLCYVIAWKTM